MNYTKINTFKKVKLFPCKIIYILLIGLIYLFASRVVYADDILSSWNSTVSLPYDTASNVAYAFNNKIYQFTGASSIVIPSNLSLDVTLNHGISSSWISGTNPPPVFWASLAAKGNSVYILGGATYPPGLKVNGVYLGKIDNSGNINSWISVTSLPKRLGVGASAIFGDKIYFAGGDDDTTTSSSIYFAQINNDGTLGNWIQTIDLPAPTSSFSMIIDKGHLIVIGGLVNINNVKTDTAKVYTSIINANGTLAGWQETSNLPISLTRPGVALVGSYIVVAGGNSSSGASNKVYFAKLNSDGTVGPWEQSSHDLPQPICCGAATSLNNDIYIIGGFNSISGYLNTVYYSNVSPQQDLSVPLLKQTDPLWAGNEYDSAHVWTSGDQSIGAYGCALTSAAMVLNYYGIYKLPDGTTLDPGTLNDWLKNQIDGYSREGYVNWSSFGRLSKEAVGINHITAFDALEYSYSGPNDYTSLTYNLQHGIPGILEEHGSSSGGMHFVVAKGVSGNTYDINDPDFAETSLAGRYGNAFASMKTLAPKNTDLSYMVFTIDPSLQLIVKDSNGNTVGQQFLQNPIEDDVNGGSSQEPLTFVYVPKPDTGEYHVSVSGPANTPYSFDEYLYDVNGEVNLSTQSGTVNSSAPDRYIITFDKQEQNNDSTKKGITLNDLQNDLQNAFSNGKIKFGTYTALTAIFKTTQLNNQNGIKPLFDAQLHAMISVLTAQQKWVETNTYQLLLSDLQYLQAH